MSDFKTGIYIRVSTEEQAKHGYSVRAQREKLMSYAKIKEWEIYDIYIDEGISGKNLNRSEVQRLIADVKSSQVNNVLVYKIDRLTRSTKDLIDLIELFQACNCAFNSLTEAIDTASPAGRMFVKIIGLFAEFERETIVERIKVGLERKVREGYSLCSSTPSYGYSRSKGEKVQTVERSESKIVKDIFAMYLNGTSITDIAKKLNGQKVHTKKNRQWTTKNIINILTNPNYIGKVRYGINTNHYFETVGRHTQIIDEKQYYEVREKLQNRLRTKSDAYYSNKLECLCHQRMATKRTYFHGKCYINYICHNHNCDFKSVSHRYLDKYLNIANETSSFKEHFVQEKIKKIKIISLDKQLEINHY